MSKMTVGLISSAHVHADSYVEILKSSDAFHFIGVWDDDQNRGKRFCNLHGVDYFDRFEDLISTCECVVVTSENVKHKEHITKCAGKVKGILCEKPLAPTIDDAQKMIEVCAKQGTNLCTAFPVRFHPVSKRVKEIVVSKELGEIKMIISTNRGKVPPGWFTSPELSGGGAIMDHVVHVVDFLRWSTGKEFRTVRTSLGRQINKGLQVEDCAILELKLEEIPVTLDCSWGMPVSYPYWGEVKIRLILEKGVIEADVFSQNIVFRSNESHHEEWINYGDNADEVMLLSFVDFIRYGTDFPTAKDGLEATRVVEKAYESVKLNREVVIHGEER